jgi:hypothetical protein
MQMNGKHLEKLIQNNHHELILGDYFQPSKSMTLKEFERIAYLSYHLEHNELTDDERNELHLLLLRWKYEYDIL